MKSIYKAMRLVIIFDLPTETKADKKVYTKFRKFLLTDGYVMLQFSVYVRYCHNNFDVEKHIIRIKKNNPRVGDVRIIKITESQYENMMILCQRKQINNKYEDKSLIVIE